MNNELTIRTPDDWHCHFRDDEQLARTVTDSAACFARAIAMPNLKSPVLDVAAANAYYQRIQSHIPKQADFTPLMTLYLTANTSAADIKAAATSEIVFAVKLYPAGATTGSAHGVTDLSQCDNAFAAMQQHDIPLLIHAESIDPNVDIFDRERVFIEKELTQLIARFPELRIVIEHASTKFAVDFVHAANDKLAATITPHHLWSNRNALFKGGLQPDYYCLPILKRAADQQALLAAATGGHKKFFLGSDSAPHSLNNKYKSCGCAGIYNAPVIMPALVELFAANDTLQHLEAFTSINGANFYQLPLNDGQLRIVKRTWQVPRQLTFGDATLTPFLAEQTLNWQCERL